MRQIYSLVRSGLSRYSLAAAAILLIAQFCSACADSHTATVAASSSQNGISSEQKQQPPAGAAKRYALPAGFKDTWTSQPPPQAPPQLHQLDQAGAKVSAAYPLQLYIWSLYSRNKDEFLKYTVKGSDFEKQFIEVIRADELSGKRTEGGSNNTLRTRISEWDDSKGTIVLVDGKDDIGYIFSTTTGKLVSLPPTKTHASLWLIHEKGTWRVKDIGANTHD